MVLSLVDLSLHSIAQNLGQISQARKFLPPRDKEKLLERMCWHKQFTSALLPSVTYHLFSETLKRVCFEDNSQVTDGLLVQLGSCKCKLTHLTVSSCKNVTDEGLEMLLRTQDTLVELCLNNFGRSVSMSGLNTVHASQLESVDLSECDGLTDVVLGRMVQNCPQIKKLVVKKCTKLTSVGIKLVAESLQGHLEWLDLYGLNKVADPAVLALSRCRNLKVLLCHGCSGISASALSQLQSCHLTWLDLAFCYGLADAGVAQLTDFQHIQKLSLSGLPVQASVLVTVIEAMPQLTELELCGIAAINDIVLEEICTIVGHRLLSLNLSSCTSLTDKGCSHISRHCRCLKKMNLSLCRELTGVGLLSLLQDRNLAENLLSLKFSGCKALRLDVIESIADHCLSLRVLILAGVLVVDDFLVQKLADGCRKLQYVSFKGCQQLTDDPLCSLIRHCLLRVFVVSGISSLTDKIIVALTSHCSSTLEEVYLQGCAYITPAAVRYLQDNCVKSLCVYHQIPNAPPNLLMAKNLDTGKYCKMSTS